LQDQLSAYGFSSLGRAESHVMDSLLNVEALIAALLGREPLRKRYEGVFLAKTHTLLAQNTEELLGKEPDKREVRILVTLPETAATDYELVRELLAAGMDCARVNCAHDNRATWKKMIANVRKAQEELGKDCRILMDLAGPKLRTGAIAPDAKVVSWHPKRDKTGELLSPALVWLGIPKSVPPKHVSLDAVLTIQEPWILDVTPGEVLVFRDRRGKNRQLVAIEALVGGLLAEAWETAFVDEKTSFRYTSTKGEKTASPKQLPALEKAIFLKKGDTLLLTGDHKPGEPARLAGNGNTSLPARIPCTLPVVFADVKVGERVRFDDGKMEGVIQEIRENELAIEMTNVKGNGCQLKTDKGINFPDTYMRVTGLTEKDIDDLDFVAQFADIVSLSFVNEPEDVSMLIRELQKRNADHLGVVLKIETQRGFKNLPWLLLEAMKSHPTGIMIARGDLAVECGWVRMAEVQEEILWFCEAAHLPVIWATQVLETLAKKGLPSRAEITDAAMSQRAECVMLNKGPHIVEAVNTLNDILCRMQDHQRKKSSRLRRLGVTETDGRPV
jgi:pyruvate kinase